MIKTKKQRLKAVHTIPQLRRLFEHIEDFVDSHIAKHESKEALSKKLRKEWMDIFKKPLTKQSADSFIASRTSRKKPLRHHTRKHTGGMAPIDYTTRQGVYSAPSGISGGDIYGVYPEYVSSGFSQPEIAQLSDPVKGQSPWPTPIPGMGFNSFVSHKGGKRKIRGGSAALTQAFSRPFGSSAPPSIPQDMQDIFNGRGGMLDSNQATRPVMESYMRYQPPSFNFKNLP